MEEPIGQPSMDNEEFALALQKIAKAISSIDNNLPEKEYLEEAYSVLKRKTISNFKHFRDDTYPPMVILVLKDTKDKYKMIGMPLVFSTRAEEIAMRDVAKSIINNYRKGNVANYKVIGVLHYFIISGAEYSKEEVKDRTPEEFINSKDYKSIDENQNTFDAIIFTMEQELTYKFEIVEYIMSSEDIVFSPKPRTQYEGALFLDETTNPNIFYVKPDPFAEEKEIEVTVVM